MKKLDINIQNLSKIEGHADLAVKVRQGEVQSVQLGFTESKRFFTQAIKNKNLHMLPQSVARICGTCSIAHTLCCLEGLEKALNVQVSPQTALLKKLTMYGLMIRDHALHMYLFSLPDVFNKDSVLDFSGVESKFLHQSFDVKRAGNKLSTAVAGRAVHAPFPVIGGFAQVPHPEEIKDCRVELKKARDALFDVLEVYYNCPIDYSRPTDFVGLVNNPFDFLEGDIVSSDGTHVPESKYRDFLHKVVIPYSESVGYTFDKKTYMVGALARLNLNKQSLHKDTRKDAAKFLQVFPSNNIFHNNLAQGIEILHSIDHSLEILESAEFKLEAPVPVKVKQCEGIGVIEAPRGTLFYKLLMDGKGIIKKGTIIVPTQQNQINMELDIKNLVQRSLASLSHDQIEYEIEKLIRAYDPCISCATHFLKVRWV